MLELTFTKGQFACLQLNIMPLHLQQVALSPVAGVWLCARRLDAESIMQFNAYFLQINVLANILKMGLFAQLQVALLVSSSCSCIKLASSSPLVLCIHIIHCYRSVLVLSLPLYSSIMTGHLWLVEVSP